MDVREAGHVSFFLTKKNKYKISHHFVFHEMVLFLIALRKYAFLNLNLEEGLNRDMKMRVDLKTS